MSNGDVAYTTRDLVLRIEGKLDALQVALINKVDRSELTQLDVRVVRLEAWRNRILGGLIAVGAVASAVAAKLVGIF